VDISERSHLILGFQFEQETKQYWGISLGPEQDASSSIIGSAYTSEEEIVQPVFFSHNAAFYIQDDYRLGENYHFTGGLRFDADDEYGHVFNPRLGLVGIPFEHTGFKVLYGEAYKAPTVFELFDEFRGNERLEPEEVATTEIEINHNFSSKALVRAGYFYSSLTNIIVVASNPDPTEVPIGPNSEYLDYYQNIGSTNISGLTLNGDFQLVRGVYGYANYTYTVGEDGEEIDNISQHKANFGINYLLRNRINFNLRANWRGQVKAPASNNYYYPKDAAIIALVGYDYMTEEDPDGYMDGHFLLNFTLTGRKLFGDGIDLEPQLSVRNLLDTEYSGIGRQSGSGTRPLDELQPLVQNPSGFIPPYHPQPGREVYLTLRYGFSL
jgi:outer membrane receptor for ferrienterochelin and colicins